MGWETRGNHQYYYRKLIENGRVRSLYIGTGPLADAWAEKIEHERQALAAEREACQRMASVEHEIDESLSDLATILRALTSAVLVANGYYAHRRQWRRLKGE